LWNSTRMIDSLLSSVEQVIAVGGIAIFAIALLTIIGEVLNSLTFSCLLGGLSWPSSNSGKKALTGQNLRRSGSVSPKARRRKRYQFTVKAPASRAKKNRFTSKPVTLSRSSPQLKYRRFRHGTTLKNAIDIYNTQIWFAGHSLPTGVYVTDTNKIAKQYSGEHGGIVLVDVDRGVKLTKRYEGVYVFEIPNAKPYQEYYRIEGFSPVGVLDAQGNRIK